MKLRRIDKTENSNADAVKTWSLPCFYCSVDSWQLKTFLIVVIGCLVAASVSVLIGAWLRGHFRAPEKLNSRPLEIEEKEDVI